MRCAPLSGRPVRPYAYSVSDICSWQATIIEPDEDDDEDDMTGVKFHAESFVK